MSLGCPVNIHTLIEEHFNQSCLTIRDYCFPLIKSKVKFVCLLAFNILGVGLWLLLFGIDIFVQT